MADPIEHIVVLMLENNSFDRMLGCMNQIYQGLEGVDPTDPFSNPDYPDSKPLIQQNPNDLTAIASDPGHDLDNVLRQIGKSDCQGFVADFAQHCPQAKPAERNQIMGYFQLDDLPVLHTLARHFAVCDQWFSSVPGPTWPNRFFVHSGTSLGQVDMPEGILHPAIHLYNQPTVFRRLSERHISWRIYYGDVPQSLVMTDQLLYPEHYRLMQHFAADAAADAASFPQYVFIEPCYFGSGQNDQHPPTDVAHGEALIAQVYNSIRQNEKLWQSTLFIVLYDEHGGFCDHVPPPATVAPDKNTRSFAFNLLGLRVPALLISPWLDPGVVHTVMDHTSLLKYLTDKWVLGPLGDRVPAADSFASAISRTSARTDCPTSIAIPAARPNDMNVALNAHQIALAGFAQQLEATTGADDSTIAAHVRGMAGDYQSQSHASAERIQQFLARSSAKAAHA